MSEDRVPSIGVVVVGDDLDICAAVAGVIRSAFVENGVGSKTIAMDNLTSQPSFLNFHDQYQQDSADECLSLWDKMCRDRPNLHQMVIPIEVVSGTAVASSKSTVQDRGYIRTNDNSLELECVVEWAVPPL